MPSHNQASYTQEAAKPSVGSISLGLPRPQESAKSGQRVNTHNVSAKFVASVSNSALDVFMFLLLWSTTATVPYIKQEEFSPRSQNSQPEGLLVRAQHEGVVRGKICCSAEILNFCPQ